MQKRPKKESFICLILTISFFFLLQSKAIIMETVLTPHCRMHMSFTQHVYVHAYICLEMLVKIAKIIHPHSHSRKP